VDAGLALLEDDRLLMPVARSPGGDEPGTLPYFAVGRDCSAVSRDCLMVRRDLFHELGGFDERLDGRLIEADFCLHARAKGHPVVSTPLARLHAAGDLAPPSPAAAEVYRARWGAAHERGDPYFSPNFSRRRDGFRVNEEPTVFGHAPAPLIDRESVRRVLVVKPDHVGDVLLALPAVRRLKEIFPEAELTLLVGPHTRSLAEREPAVDRVLTYEFFFADSHKLPRQLADADRARLRAWLGAYGFDLAVDLRRETDSRELVRLSGARWTVGFADPGEAEWLTLSVPSEGPLKLLKPGRHMSQDLLRLADLVERVMGEPSPAPAPRPEEDAEVTRLFDAVVPGGHRILVGIHPGSGRPIKCWPAAYFGRLAGMFAERLGAAVVVFGGPGEEGLAAEVICSAPPGTPAVSLAGRFGLAAFSAAVRRCDLFVGNDSGPTHLAAAAGVPVLGVYAGTADPVQWGPLGVGAAAIQRALLCTPCYVSRPRDCPLGVPCTKYLHPEPVFEAAVRVLLPRWGKLESAGGESAVRAAFTRAASPAGGREGP
jgi:ADP-heptose:LPS heptosyltransferase